MTENLKFFVCEETCLMVMEGDSQSRGRQFEYFLVSMLACLKCYNLFLFYIYSAFDRLLTRNSD